jgi:ABC-type lipoprotein release transport system permease subunit
MIALLKLAWRNIWRNRRRTVLTSIAIVFGLVLIIIQRGLAVGTYVQMIETGVRRSEGHIQVHKKDYWEKKTLKYAFNVTPDDTARISAIPGVERISLKLTVDALVGANSENTTGAKVVGVIPSLEKAMTIFSNPKKGMKDGHFLRDTDTTGALIGYTMAKNIRASVGDTLVVLTQARDGSMGAGRLIVRGIFRAGEPEMDGYMVLAHIEFMRRILVAEDRVTAIAMTVDDVREMSGIISELRGLYPDGPGEKWEVMGYDQLLPALMQMIAFDESSGFIFLILLLVVIAFGIMNTILMSVMERFHEFGVMMAVGMKRRAVAAMVFLEGVLLSLVGLVVGNILGWSLNRWWELHPIHITGEMGEMYEIMGMEPVIYGLPDFGEQMVWSIIVVVLTLIVAMWPALTAMRFRPVEAIRQV